ncbi:MAG: hypothetical protein J6U96_03930, partial [Elusimicrobiaceae bacterium]|nr:hypothetical protein [Elusimicrobiaceae bacterium]
TSDSSYWIFCCLGLVLNTIVIWRDLHGPGLLLRLHIGFWVLYAAQVVFILMRERMVFILSLLQAILALATNLDFTFVPPLRMIGQVIYMVHGQFSLDGMEVYKYVFVSACFTLELLKTFLLWWLIPSHKELTAEKH